MCIRDRVKAGQKLIIFPQGTRDAAEGETKKGAAMLAVKGCGACGSLEELAARTLQVTDTAFPDAEIVRRYEARYPVFRALYPTLRTLT